MVRDFLNLLIGALPTDSESLLRAARLDRESLPAGSAATKAAAAPLLAEVGDSNRLAKTGEWIVQCTDEPKFLARIASLR